MRLPALVALATLASAAQVPFHTASTTVADLLYADPDYEALVRLLQRTRLIPTINRLNASTLFAPTNDAVHRHASAHPLWRAALQDPPHFLADNVQEKLRQQLFYHLLNYTLDAAPANASTLVLDTLLFPRKPPEGPTHEPPPSPPWLPLPGGTLGGAPQRLRIAAREGHGYVSVDAFGKGGVEIVKQKKSADNGVVFGIKDILVPPPDLGQPLFFSR
jgi:solute carrier family 25 carnitine/acylcarnitine transporter 20/29